MKKPLWLFLLTLSSFSYSQNFTNKGKDFWVGYGNHVRMFNSGIPEKMEIYITSDVNTTGTVNIPGLSFSKAFSIISKQITTIEIPRTAALTNEGKYDFGIHITAQKPVVVYSFIYVNAISGATVCLPTTTLGRDYYSINYTQVSNEDHSYSYFFAVATDTGMTSLEINPTRNTLGGRPGSIPFIVNLQQGQVYQVLSANDLSGSRIRSISNGSGCKKIAVFCGSGKISIGCQYSGTSDNLYQQMYPTSTWGKTYITVPSINAPGLKSQYNFLRVFKSDPTAAVKLNGRKISSEGVTNGQFQDLQMTNEPSLIEADKPILVAQYFATQGCSGNSGDGDPEMIYLNPLEQTINSVTLNSMQPIINTNIDQHFVNVVLKNNSGAINTFKIDGIGYPFAFTPHPNAAGYAYARIQVNQGTHTITCDTPFNAISYGFGQTESYGYSAGTNLNDLYQYVSISNDFATVNFPACCKNSSFKFWITFPYKPTRISWQFHGLFPDTTMNEPNFDSTWMLNGRKLYRYKLNKSYNVNDIGTYPISVVANNPIADGCSGVQEIEYDLQVFDRPKADFSFKNSGCVPDSVVFTDETNGQDRTVEKWNWDFGDNVRSSVKNPKHKYYSGTFTVRHSAITDIGCLSDTVVKSFSIADPPVAKFGVSLPGCEKVMVTLSDSSYTTGGKLAKWRWDLGDGTILNGINNSPVEHIYNSAGTYDMTLQVETTSGCTSPKFPKAIKIGHSPKPSFGIPEICLNDPYCAFTDSSTIAGGTGPLTYLWNFGDMNSDEINPNSSTERNPNHKFTAVGTYNVRLTVKSTDGCAEDTIQQLTVNGPTPVARFSMQQANFCSGGTVTIKDSSSVMEFGNVVRVEIYWDYENDPSIKTIDENPSPGKLYTHEYPQSSNQSADSYQLRYIAYSGINCLKEISKVLSIHQTPVIQFDPLMPVCEEVKPFPLSQAKEINGFPGTGKYNGPGVTTDGQFNPSLAGPGVHTVRYSFNATNGCAAFKEEKILVFPSPYVDAGPDRTVFEGASITLDGHGSGHNVNYVWTPNLSMDNNQLPTPKISPADDIVYKLTVTSSDGCKATDEVFVKILRELNVPNAFTPNNDGINDRWAIQYLESYPGCTVEVYNRFGQLVFRSVGYNPAGFWDGTLNGKPLPVGTYYWIINPKNGRKQMDGSVTIIR